MAELMEIYDLAVTKIEMMLMEKLRDSKLDVRFMDDTLSVTIEQYGLETRYFLDNIDRFIFQGIPSADIVKVILKDYKHNIVARYFK